MSDKETNLINGGVIDIDVNRILKTENKDVDNIRYEIILHTEKDDIKLELVESIEVMRDYNKHIGDYTIIVFQMAGGEFAKRVYPHRDHMEVTVIKSWVDNTHDTVTNKYKGIIINQEDGLDAGLESKADETTLNETKLMKIEMQLMLRELEGLRSVYVDGIYKNSTIEEIIQAVIMDGASNIEVEGNPLDINIDVFPVNNTFSYKNLTIPTGVNLTDMPSYIQNTSYGVYNGAIGTYFQWYKDKYCMFVYPLYHTTRYDKERGGRLTIYHANSHKYDYVENTYAVDGDNISMLAGNNLNKKDLGTNKLLNLGDGIVDSASEEILNRNFEITDTGVNFDSSKQLSGVKIIDRKDGYTKNRFVGASSNMYTQRSATLMLTLANYIIPWKYSNTDLIYPGMPCCFIFEDSVRGLVKLKGTVQGINTRYTMSSKVHVSLLHVCVESSNVWADDIKDK